MTDSILPDSPSLEEMLSRGRPEPLALSLAILHTHYSSLARLSLALSGAVSPGLSAILVAALRSVRQFRPQAGADTWLYTVAWRTLKSLKTTPAPGAAISPPGEFEAVIWHWFDALGKREQQLAVLKSLLDLPSEIAASLLRVSVSAIETQHALNLQAVREALSQAGFTSPQDSAALESQLRLALQARWPAPPLTEADLLSLAQQAVALAQAQQQTWERQAFWRTLGRIGLVSLVVLGTALLLSLLSPRGVSSRVANIQPLTPRTSSETIRLRLENSAALWRSLFLEAQIIVYGPSGYIGPARAYRLQAWLRQPDQGLELFGLLGDPPSRTWITFQGSQYLYAPQLGEGLLQPISDNVADLLYTDAVRRLVFPRTSPWLDPLGYFQTLGLEEVAGRQALRVNWLDADNVRLWQLWLDTVTGMPLRVQEFTPYDPPVLSQEVILTTVIFEPTEDLNDLLQSARNEALDFAETASGHSLTPALGDKLPERRRLPAEPAPAALDPAPRWLTFQLPTDDFPLAQSKGLTASAEIFADGYYLGTAPLGYPWSLRCQRSPDGQLLAYTRSSDGVLPGEAGLFWLNLNRVEAVYQVLPGLKITDFAFAPDSRQLAAIGTGLPGVVSGLYLVDLPTGESRLLLELAEAHGLSWSPDGEQLALIGSSAVQLQAQVLVLQVRTGQVVFRAAPPEVSFPLPVDWPIAGWGKPFPPATADLGSCVPPPNR